MGVLKAQELRDTFVSFFEEHGHTKVASSSLVPHDDATLLFANAGMNQFKDYFTGRVDPPHLRAVTIQKCVRAGGKHNDLEEVGHSPRHHTFFEMLGNFSFGDYFKKEAIHYAWNFLTEKLNLPKEKLFVSVHKSDREAFDLWIALGIPEEKLFFREDKDNFWEMGEVGPCGPCSEIFYDYGEDYGPSPALALDNEDRFVEIWNLVFMQYEKYREGPEIKTRPLPNPCVDTGAGLERLLAVVQGVYWNYETDLFLPIIDKIKSLTKTQDDESSKRALRAVADHMRSSVMLITDGVVPSNEGRGYVLRRIIRRALRYTRQLQAPSHILSSLVPSVFQVLGKEYPRNFQGEQTAVTFLKSEEEKFLHMLDGGMAFFENALKGLGGKGELGGEVLFKLYDTFGFPPDLTESILAERGLQANRDVFNQLMDERRRDSRKSWKGNEESGDERFHQALKAYGKTEFLGYNTLSAQGRLLDIIDLDDGVKGLLFDKTPFYAESGGQVGDRGHLLQNGRSLCRIFDVQKKADALFVHLTKDVSSLETGAVYSLEVDGPERKEVARHHSATHLLQSALISVLGNHVKQAGSFVDKTKLRFDFTHPTGLGPEAIIRIEEVVNGWIQDGSPVLAHEMSMDEAVDRGAIAFFGDKYGNRVRVLEMGQVSLELCGGTHVSNTSEIGLFTILSESSLSSGVRRVEAICGPRAHKYLVDRSRLFGAVEQEMQGRGASVLSKISSLRHQLKDQAKELKKLGQQLQSKEGHRFFQNPERLANVDFVFSEIPGEYDLRELSDSFVSSTKKGLAILYTKEGSQVRILLRSTKGLDVHCGNLLREALAKFDGKGGGRADMAQGVGKTSSIPSLVDFFRKAIS